jgi:SOS response regulatory protein OraA/RecX
MGDFQNGLSDQAIINASGRTWQQWFDELKQKGFNHKSEEEIIQALESNYFLDNDWAKDIARTFSDAYDLSKAGIKKKDFEISVRKTFPHPIESVVDHAKNWLSQHDRALITKVNEKCISCEWKTDHSNVEVQFLAKGKSKTQMVVQHDNLKSSIDAEIMRNFWKENISSIVEAL